MFDYVMSKENFVGHLFKKADLVTINSNQYIYKVSYDRSLPHMTVEKKQ